MAFLVGCLLAFAFIINTEAQLVQSSTIDIGSSLTTAANSSWLSSSGLYAFGLYKQGDVGYAVGIMLAGIPQKTVVWTVNRDGPYFSDNATLFLTTSGVSSTPIATSNEDVFSASMLDSGNFVLYNSDQEIIFQSFDYATDTLLPNQKISAAPGFPTNTLFSSKSESDRSTGIFRLRMQTDGNLVQFPVNSPDNSACSYYESNTNSSGANVTLNLDVDGHLYLRNAAGTTILNFTYVSIPTDQRKSYLMRIDVDGIFRLYSYSLQQNGNFSVEWSSSNDKCDPLGLCGLNSYCVMMDQEAECKCLPGFESVDPGNRTLGCGRNWLADICSSENNITYSMEELESISWESLPYIAFPTTDEEECKKACLEDCNCEVALLVQGSCGKQRLPLKYGRRLLTVSDMAFIKVPLLKPPRKDEDFQERSQKKGRVVILIIGVSFAAFGTTILVISLIVLCKHNAWAYKRMNQLNGDAEWNEDMAPQPYTYEQLEKMTNNFNEEIGRGACGTIYKGTILNSQKLVAVKRLDKVAAEGVKEFQTEMKVIARTHHRSLVRLLGHCLEGPKKLLVYQSMF